MEELITDIYPELKSIPKESFPNHILIIPDGNGRWAKQEGKPIAYGHKRGAEVVEKLLTDLKEIHEISIITIWGFSADNWKRSKDEVNALFLLMQFMIKKSIALLKKQHAKFVVIGRRDRIPKYLQEIIKEAEEETKENNGQTVCIAIDFAGEDQMIRMLESARNIPLGIPITTDLALSLRDGNGKIPHADLIIRTSGEMRVSDIGWLNGAGSELYFIDKLFPEIKTQDIIDAIVAFSKRNRRFGTRPAELEE